MAGTWASYVFNVIVVSVVFLVLDAFYKSEKNQAFLYIGFVYSALLTEQAATTALVSSGIGFLIVMVLLLRSDGSVLNRPA